MKFIMWVAYDRLHAAISYVRADTEAQALSKARIAWGDRVCSVERFNGIL